MTTYNFETITAAEAMAIKADDYVLFKGAPSTALTVFYNADYLTFVFGGRSVDFGLPVTQASAAGHLQFADRSQIFIGDEWSNLRSFTYENAYVTTLFGGSGDDTLAGSFGETFIHGNLGNDSITAMTGHNAIYGGQGDDSIVIYRTGDRASQPGSFAHGNLGDDIIQGGSGDDTLLGGQGNDHIYGNEGRDYINGNLGDDFLIGSAHGGQTHGEAGNDSIFGGGAPGQHYISGGDGDDWIQARGHGETGGNSTVDGGSGADTIAAGGRQHDMLSGGAGDDSLWSGGNEPDRVGDHLYGNEGADYLVSASGSDTLYGGDGFDTLNSLGIKAVMYGEGGTDIFRIIVKDVTNPAQIDEIRDWTSADYIAFSQTHYGDGFSARADQTTAGSASSYVQALQLANELASSGAYNLIKVQVGVDLIVFADMVGDNRVDAAVILTGITSSDFSHADLI